MHYHKLGYLFGRHGGLGGSDAIFNGTDEALNLGTCSFLDAQFRFIPIVVIYLSSGSN